nr:hypothetical protein [Tanacetum cinerariifolium]
MKTCQQEQNTLAARMTIPNKRPKFYTSFKSDFGLLISGSPFWPPFTNCNQSNPSVGVQEQFDEEKAGEENVQQYVFFLVWSSASKSPQNTDGDVPFEVKEPEFEGRTHESKVYVSPSSSAQTKKHDDKTKGEATGKSLVESSIGYKNLSAEFEDFSDNNINEVNAARALVPAIGQLSTNSTNTFSAAGPFNTAVSPTHRKYSYADSSQLPDDPNMPELEDITYYDEEDVGAEVNQSSMRILERNLHVTIILSASQLATPQMVLNSPYLTHIKNWLVQIKRSLCMSAKRTAWNEFSSSMASAVICLSTADDKSTMAQQADEGVVEVHVDDVPTAGVADEGAASVVVDDVPAAAKEPSIPSPTPPPPPSQDLPSTLQVQPTLPPSLIAQPPSPQQQPQPTQPSHDVEMSMDLLHTLLDTCTTLTRRVKNLEENNITQALEITKVDTSEATIMDDVSKQEGIIANMDADEDVTLKDVADIAKEVVVDAEIEENADPAKLKEVVEVVTTAKLMTEVVIAASASITIVDTPILVAAVTTAPRMTYDDIRPIFEKKFNSNVDFLVKLKEQMEEEDSKALKRKVESLKDKAAKKQKLDEEVDELRKHIQMVPNDDDDVYTKATPLALKVPVVDYEIYIENNKPYYKIKRADETHQLYLSFLSMLRNFDREDLEVLWKLVKERFASSKPKNFSKDFLLTTLGAMFEKPDVQA